ncbi:MAG: DUF305 domain-containing protein [Gemmatimonadales bacterium]
MLRSFRARSVACTAVLVASLAMGLHAQTSSSDGAGQDTTQWPGRYPYTKADIDFVTGMIAHHAQAVLMAGWAPDRARDPSVKTLCARILNAQTGEINLMQEWLRERHQPVPEPDPYGMKMAMGGAEHEMLMPGMLNRDELDSLKAATGYDFDRLFLHFMISHHQGAVTMVQQLFAAPGAGQDEWIFKFASDVNTDQSTEIVRMQKMLLLLQGR